MKKSVNCIILGAILSIIAISTYIFTQNQIEIPKEMIISAVKSHFPIKKSMYTLGDMKLSNPTVYFENDKLIIDADYEFKDRATSELTTGKANFESELEYILKFNLIYNLKPSCLKDSPPQAQVTYSLPSIQRL